MTSGFSQGDDYVAARLSIDIPDSSIQGIRELTGEVDRFRTSMEAVAHSEADMTRYLNSMAQATQNAAAAQAQLTQHLQTYISMTGGRESGGGPYSKPPMGVMPGPASQPFEGATLGMGTDRRPAESDIANQLSSARIAANPREFLNMQQARGNITPQDSINISQGSIHDVAEQIAEREEAIHTQARLTDHNASERAGKGTDMHEEFQRRVNRAQTLAGQVMNEVGRGGSVVGMGQMILQGINFARKRISAQAPGRAGAESKVGSGASIPEPGVDSGAGSLPGESGPAAEEVNSIIKGAGGGGLLAGLGGIVSKLGTVGTVLTAAIAGFKIFEQGGKMVQDARNVASIRGGAAGEGFQTEARAKLLAMNPFISQDQARQIYQAVLSDGYADASGSGADNVIDFMKSNIESLNMSVAESAKTLRSAILGTGDGSQKGVTQALDTLRTQLDAIRDISKEGVISQPEFRAKAGALRDQLIDQGVSTDAAGAEGIGMENMFSGDRIMAGMMGDIQGNMMSNPALAGAMMRNFGGQDVPTRLLPQNVPRYLAEHGGLEEAEAGVIEHLRDMSRVGPGSGDDEVSKMNADSMMQQRMSGMGLGNFSIPQIEDLMSKSNADLAGEIKRIKEDNASHGMGGGKTEVSGSVSLDINVHGGSATVNGPRTISLTSTQKAANRGWSNAQVNDDPDG